MRDFLRKIKRLIITTIYLFENILFYKTKIVDGNKIKFFTPNSITKWRVKTLFTKEPETLEWIDNFKTNKDTIFWDIGANIGLYSIYAISKHADINVVSFEPSTSNLRVLSRNISINNFENKIKISPFALTNKENQYLLMNESRFVEGAAIHSFGQNIENNITAENNYKIYGTSINYLLRNKILQIPKYIKINVDGIEDLILEGASDFLSNEIICSLSIEIDENLEQKYENIMQIMKKNNFKLKHKKNYQIFYGEKNYTGTLNYVFER